ncbi:MAG: hypothetical protein AMXMBFR34_53490 [Myxococcaceae bacterium]
MMDAKGFPHPRVKSAEPLRALELLARAQRADPKNEARVGGRAAAEAALIQASLAATRERGRAFASFLEAWPSAVEAPAFLHALEELTARAGLPRADLARARSQVTTAWVSADDGEQLNDLVYLLLELGDLGGAARLAARLEALDPNDAWHLATAPVGPSPSLVCANSTTDGTSTHRRRASPSPSPRRPW